MPRRKEQQEERLQQQQQQQARELIRRSLDKILKSKFVKKFSF
jgi:hypothetical protein